MTTINSPTSRVSRFPFARYGVDNKPLVVTIEPLGVQGDFISLRLLRGRESLRIDLNELYAYLLRQKAMKAHMQKISKRRKSVKRFHALTR